MMRRSKRCAYILSSEATTHPRIAAYNLRSCEDAEAALAESLHHAGSRLSLPRRTDLAALPGGRMFYSIPQAVHSLLRSQIRFEPDVGTARQGLTTFDDFRFLRTRWEVPAAQIGKSAMWVPFSRGSGSVRYYSDQCMVVKWNKDGSEMSEKNREVNGQTAQARQGSDYYFRPGGTYSLRGQAV